jgi:MFS transporter, FHS family, L-fucose permease
LLILAKSVSGTSLQGALLTPAQRMNDALAVRAPYIGIAILLLLLALAIALWPLPAPAARDAPEKHRRESILRRPRLLLGIAAIFFYVGAEISVGSFLTNYVASARVGNFTHAQAAFYVTLFWSGAMIGRFVGAGVMRSVPPYAVLGGNALIATALVLISISTRGQVALWSIVLVGCMNSIMFPTIFTLAIEGLGHLTQRGSGLLIMAIVGGAVMPLLQAIIADQSGLAVSYLVPVACYVYVLFFALRCRSPLQESGA